MTPAEIKGRVDEVFDRFMRMNDAELLTLRAIWDDANPDERERAWTNVKSLVKTLGREGQLDNARHRVSKWINNNPVSPGIFGMSTLPSNPSGLDQGSVRQAAMPPLLDAIAATIVADEIDADDATTLLEPLTQVGL